MRTIEENAVRGALSVAAMAMMDIPENHPKLSLVSAYLANARRVFDEYLLGRETEQMAEEES